MLVDAGIWLDDDNPVAMQVDSPGGDSPVFSLTAHVKETSPDAANYGADPGDINNAQVSMTLTAVGQMENKSPLAYAVHYTMRIMSGTTMPVSARQRITPMKSR